MKKSNKLGVVSLYKAIQLISFCTKNIHNFLIFEIYIYNTYERYTEYFNLNVKKPMIHQ